MSHGEMAANVAIVCSVAADGVFSWCSKSGASREVAEQSQLDARWDDIKSPNMTLCVSSWTLGQQVWITVTSWLWGLMVPHFLAPLNTCISALWHRCVRWVRNAQETLPTIPWELAIVNLSKHRQQCTTLGRIFHELFTSNGINILQNLTWIPPCLLQGKI